MGNLNYVLYGRKGKEIRPDLYCISGDVEIYRYYEQYEKNHSKSTNIGSVFLVGVPHELHNLSKDDMKKYVNDLGKHLFGEHIFVGVVHKVKTSKSSTGYNIHIHYNIADRLIAERNPVKYKRDVWVKEDGTLAKSKAERFKKIHEKGDYKLDENGNYIYDSEPFEIKSKEFMDSNKIKWHRWNQMADDFNYFDYAIKKNKQWVKHVHLGYNPNKDMIRRNELAKAINQNMNALAKNLKSTNMSAESYWESLIGFDNSYKHTENLEKINEQIVKDISKTNGLIEKIKENDNKIKVLEKAKKDLDSVSSKINSERSSLMNKTKSFFGIKNPLQIELERKKEELIKTLDDNVPKIDGFSKNDNLRIELDRLSRNSLDFKKKYVKVFSEDKDISINPIDWNSIYKQNFERNEKTRADYRKVKESKFQNISPTNIESSIKITDKVITNRKTEEKESITKNTVNSKDFVGKKSNISIKSKIQKNYEKDIDQIKLDTIKAIENARNTERVQYVQQEKSIDGRRKKRNQDKSRMGESKKISTRNERKIQSR